MINDGVLKYVKQLGFETHNGKQFGNATLEQYKKQWKIVTALENEGFQCWKWYPNTGVGLRKSKLGKVIFQVIYVYFINVNFLYTQRSPSNNILDRKG